MKNIQKIIINGILYNKQIKQSRLDCYISDNRKYFIKKIRNKIFSKNEKEVMNHLNIYGNNFVLNNNIVPLIDIIEKEYFTYHLYPFIISRDLQEQDINNYEFRKILKNIQFLHKNGIGHFDIKPENFLKSRRNIFVTDFEFSRKINDNVVKIPLRFGTQFYICPDIITNYRISLKSDIYSLGKMFYILKTHDYKFNYKYNRMLNTNEKNFIKFLSDEIPENRPNINECIDFYDNKIMV